VGASRLRVKSKHKTANSISSFIYSPATYILLLVEADDNTLGGRIRTINKTGAALIT